MQLLAEPNWIRLIELAENLIKRNDIETFTARPFGKRALTRHNCWLFGSAAAAYQMRASVAEGSPVLRKMSLTSGPDTRPSMSPSVLAKSSSYFALSAGDTTHCKDVGVRNPSCNAPSAKAVQRGAPSRSLPWHHFSYSCSFERHTEPANWKSLF